MCSLCHQTKHELVEVRQTRLKNYLGRNSGNARPLDTYQPMEMLVYVKDNGPSPFSKLHWKKKMVRERSSGSRRTANAGQEVKYCVKNTKQDEMHEQLLPNWVARVDWLMTTCAVLPMQATRPKERRSEDGSNVIRERSVNDVSGEKSSSVIYWTVMHSQRKLTGQRSLCLSDA